MPVQSIETVTAAKLTWNRPAQTKPETRWRTPAQQRIYGQRLLQALKSTRRSSSSQPLAPSRAIKEAADSALALTAKGQTRWSRAILSRRWRTRKLMLKAGGKIRRRSSNPKRIGRPGLGLGSVSGSAAYPRQEEEEKEEEEEEEEKVRGRLRVLSRLVPGCRKLSTLTLLEEAADYVGALEMQVKAMHTLADLFSTATLSSGAES